jgi:hypothetical protein
MSGFDFNDAGEQRSLDVIPAGTIVTVQINVRPGGAGDGGWLKASNNGSCRGLDCEFVVVDGDYAKRKFWVWLMVEGTTEGQIESAGYARNTLRAILESARGIQPKDNSEAAQKARSVVGYADFDQLRCVVKVGVAPPKDGYGAKNVIMEVITPDRQVWRKPDQIDPSAKANGGGAGAAAAKHAPPAGAVARPQWAG